MHRVLTITLNPAIDITTSARELVPGRKLRCAPARYDPGGGGVNVSRTIKELGGESMAFVAVAGPTGDLLRGMLLEAGLEACFFRADGLTRPSLKVFEETSGNQFRFALPGPEQGGGTTERALEALGDELARGYRFAVASGSLPPGMPEDFYARLAEIARRQSVSLILDTSGAALSRALEAGVFLVKPDEIEAKRLARDSGFAEDAVPAAARHLVETGAARVVITTLGADGALLVDAARQTRFRPPKVKVGSPVGAGDSFVGALTYALARDWSLPDACRYGVAAAAAAVQSPGTALCRRDEVERFFGQVAVRDGEGG